MQKVIDYLVECVNKNPSVGLCIHLNAYDSEPQACSFILENISTSMLKYSYFYYCSTFQDCYREFISENTRQLNTPLGPKELRFIWENHIAKPARLLYVNSLNALNDNSLPEACFISIDPKTNSRFIDLSLIFKQVEQTNGSFS